MTGTGPGPVALGEFEVTARELRLSREPAGAATARVLVRSRRHVLGELEVPVRQGKVDEELLRAATRDLPTVSEADGFARPTVSVVIATAGRAEEVRRCAGSVLAGDYPVLEILLVDNRPGGPESLRLKEFAGTDSRLRYVAEPRAGVSFARNRGAGEARGEIVAFTDDDAVPDPHWLSGLAREFADPDVGCVTGLVLPLSLDTPAQQWFEDWGGFGKGFHRTRFTAADEGRSALYPFAAGLFGSGNNMAWRATGYRALGGCDPLLGPGTPTASGEDLELFIRHVRGGGVLVYTPDAVVRHEHRREVGELAGQLHGYGVGLFALFAVYIGRRPGELFPILRRLRGGFAHLLSRDSARNAGRGADFPAVLARAELRGLLAGPFRLLKALLRRH
ncbi:glycosyltransferase [Amycolatopsis acidicola]|uniref:Glycosyltransferase n=1 Tax=Amycolatopsis acidicola TaxID=2596893 RepID=A0A5N0UW38_9PSEU|nr:glycosyltransferase [Amycolatopsis acidicola]KAA9153176.1 glycosyltransferase [Amycolatopsis acidicola]